MQRGWAMLLSGKNGGTLMPRYHMMHIYIKQCGVSMNRCQVMVQLVKHHSISMQRGWVMQFSGKNCGK